MADVFPYYAGFSFEWARNQLQRDVESPSSVIFDPWNGSGTTTLAAQSLGYRSLGVDLNPIANVVARFRAAVGSGLLVKQSSAPARNPQGTTADPLEPLSAWFSPRTARRFRDWADSLQRQGEASTSVAYVALFRVARRLTKTFEGSNPTWIRRTTSVEDLIDLHPSELDTLISGEQTAILSRICEAAATDASANFITASSRHLPVASKSVDFVLTSPPYLTRIDYAVAYARELAIMGVDIRADRTLREQLMGTTLIRPRARPQDEYGAVAGELLDRVSAHTSWASGVYYRKQLMQYLDDLTASFDEITRVSSDHATVVMVVQDSYYKEIPILLADICVDEAGLRGWTMTRRDQFEVSRSLSTLNKAARTYPKGKVAETVITFKRIE